MSAMIKRSSNLYPSLFDSFFGKDSMDQFFGPADSSNRPAVNVSENEKGYRIDLAVPGLKKEDFKISVKDDLLTISAEKETDTEEKNEKYSRKEFSYHSFQRSFALSDAVDPDNISAQYEAGVLSIAVPKREIAISKSPRQIEIS